MHIASRLIILSTLFSVTFSQNLPSRASQTIKANSARNETLGSPRDHSEFVGRYTDGADFVAYFKETKHGMSLRPALWTATQLLKESGPDEFIVIDRPARGATFHRDQQGRVVAVTIRGMEGEGQRLLRAGPQLRPVEVLLSGKGNEAAHLYLASGIKDVSKSTELASRVLSRFPSRSASVVMFLSTLAQRYPSNAALQSLLGYAQIQTGDRRSALVSLRRAYRLEPTNKDTISALARLRALPASFKSNIDPWTLPFPLKAVFDKPTPAEIRAVEVDWRTRDLTPHDVQQVTTKEVELAGSRSIVRIVSHRVHGSRHYGAIIIPPNAKPGCCPVVIEAKGVSPSYFPLSLEGLHTLGFMGDLRQQFIYLVPSYRGELLKFDGVDYQSEGDRTDAWDGATDDAIALLNVALQTTPAADANRICAFGQSRGGTVALLLGIRDRRISCVVDSAGPTDWFELMGTEGWTQEEIFGEGLRTRANPEETGGQLIDHFLLKAIRGQENLAAVRHRMLAASPLYFASRLPRALLHYGVEDPFVPVRNGLQFVAELRRHHVPAQRFQASFYPGEGHDTDRLEAPLKSREFIARRLLTTKQRH
jgi:hypothetical protein